MRRIRTTSMSTTARSTATSSGCGASSARSMPNSLRSKRFMARVTVSRRSELEGEGRGLTLKWSGRISLHARILALNIFALALPAGGFFYLDSYRTRILDTRTAQASGEARLIAAAMVSTPADHRNDLALRLARDTDTRIRLFAADGTPTADTRAMGLRN